MIDLPDEIYGAEPVCPHCGKTMTDAWELDLGDGDSAVYECGWCGKEYSIHRNVSVSYTSKKVELTR